MMMPRLRRVASVIILSVVISIRLVLWHHQERFTVRAEEGLEKPSEEVEAQQHITAIPSPSPTHVGRNATSSRMHVLDPFSDSAAVHHGAMGTNAGAKESQLLPPINLTEDDAIWSDRESWNISPIVLEQFQLIFFFLPKVACTQWGKLARRMMGFPDWSSFQPHNPTTNGLKYLYHYSLQEANHMMNDPNWTRAIFVRDPKDRFLSAYLNKAAGKDAQVRRMCCGSEQLRRDAGLNHHADMACAFDFWGNASFQDFLDLTTTCNNDHWSAQSNHFPSLFLPKLDFVGHQETAFQDSKELLQRIGAWEEFGVTGWGELGRDAFMQSRSGVKATTTSDTDTYDSKLSKYYTPALEQLVEHKYRADYERSEYRLPKRKINYDLS